MKLSHWAKSQGISYKTAHNWFRDKCKTKKEKILEVINDNN